jgi:hypothetical protein
MMIPPFEQFLSSYTVATPIGYPFEFNFVNVVAPEAAVGSITLDGVPIPASAYTPIGDSGFSGTRQPVSRGTHSLAGPRPFGLYSYGFGIGDGYGYPGGLTVRRDTTRPSCVVSATGTDGAGRRFIEVTARDMGTGLKQIDVTRSTNAGIVVPSFAAGTTAAVVVRATRSSAAQSSTVELRVADLAGNARSCDSTSTVVSRGSRRPARQVFTGIPFARHKVKIVNDDPGLGALTITVNRRTIRARGLRPGEERNVDIRGAMGPGDDNTIALVGRGRRGSSAFVVVSN